MHAQTRTVSAPLFLCDAFADERFKGNVAAVCLVADSVYCMEWSSLNMLESSIGRGQPDKEENSMSEQEREAAADKYAAERDVKMGAVFSEMAKEVNIAEMAFLYRLPAARLRNVQARIKAKADEFEREYEEQLRNKGNTDAERDNDPNDMAQNIGKMNIVIDAPNSTDKAVHAPEKEGKDATHTEVSSNNNNNANNTAPSQGQPGAAAATNQPHSPGLIPSTSFSLGIFGASFLDTRGASMLAAAGSVLGMMGAASSGNRAPRRLNTQWFGLRWFTPLRERIFCGHSSLAAAHVIYELSRLYMQKYTYKGVESVPTEFVIPSQTDVLCFVTASEIISVRRKNGAELETMYTTPAASPGLIRNFSSTVDEYEIHFPASEATSVKELLPESMSASIAEALGLPYGAECVEDIALSASMGIYVVRLAQSQYVFQCVPQEQRLRALFTTDEFAERLKQHEGKLVEPQGVAVTSLNNNHVQDDRGGEAEVISRFFAPWIGLLEDSVSATAHTAIAPYMLRHKQSGSYRVGNRIRCFQASARGGYMTCIIIGRKAERIAVTGTVVTFLRGLAFFPVEDDGTGR